MKKHFVFDDEGKLKEVRGYKDDIVVERWEIVYDESERVVGLRPLSPEDVIPQSILDRMKFWRKPKPLTQILSIDFIGLIQYIGMIYKIKKVVTIEEILEILNIKKVDVIGEITTIRDLTWSPRSLIQNPYFEEDFVSWFTTGVPTIDTTKSKYGKKSVKFPANQTSYIKQVFPIPIGVDWLSKMYCFVNCSQSDVLCLRCTYHYTDETTETIDIDDPTLGLFKRFDITPTPSSKYIEMFEFFHLVTWDMDSWLDSILTVF